MKRESTQEILIRLLIENHAQKVKDIREMKKGILQAEYSLVEQLEDNSFYVHEKIIHKSHELFVRRDMLTNLLEG